MTDRANTNNGRFLLSGIFAGAIATVVFTVVHGMFISNIWPMLLVMLVAGTLCGASISWSFGLLVTRPSLRSWLVYNLILDGMLILLGLVSVLIFEPVTTIAALSAAGGLPIRLLEQAMPLTVVFTLLMTLAITLLYGRGWKKFRAVLLTSVMLVLLLGHNVFILGLIDIPRGSVYLVLEMFGLILLLNGIYAASFIALERKNLPRASNQNCYELIKEVKS